MPHRRFLLVLALLLAFVGPVAGDSARAQALQSGFQKTTVISGLDAPTAVQFASDGRVFVAEKSGLIKVFASLSATTPTIFADFRTVVHNYWDRGLLGLALHPNFPQTPYVYLLYTYDHMPGGPIPTWGSPGATSDPCPDPPGGTTDGCVVTGRVSRITASGNTAVPGSEQVFVENYCQQFPSHSIGTIMFGNDGALYVSGGDGASFNGVDYGQFGFPAKNPCGDPPSGVGGIQSVPTAEGGALRSQDVLTGSDPQSYDGTVIRLDPVTGAAMPDNPLAGGTIADDDPIIAYGLRNPFRMAPRPGTNELWISDVGMVAWEEIDRIADTGDLAIENFGWPCYEGDGRQGQYSGLGLNLCNFLYGAPGTATDPYFTYNHSDKVVPGDVCGTGSSAVTGLAFYGTGNYPASYQGALFFADYARSCIWAMPLGPGGEPDVANRFTFLSNGHGPVDLKIGPGGDLFYVAIGDGTLNRITYVAGTSPPVAVVDADKTDGPTPLTVQFDGSGSSDPDAGDVLTYAWDLDGDGAFDDSTAVAPSFVYTLVGSYTVKLQVTDPHGATSVASVTITAGNSHPTANITTPTGATTWHVGSVINFSGSATDPEQGSLPGSALTWTLVMQHCPSNCHEHTIQSFNGASGSFTAPVHDYPSHLELRLTATDAGGLTDTKSVLLFPESVDLTLVSDPPGLLLGASLEAATAPFVHTEIVGSHVELIAPSPQTLGGEVYAFASWSDGGAQVHEVTAPASALTYTATYVLCNGDCPTPTPTMTPTPTVTAPPTPTVSPTPTLTPLRTATATVAGAPTPTPTAVGNDLTTLGSIVARVTNPIGGGNKNIEVIRNGDFPPLGSTDSAREYDTWDGVNTATEDWIGYVYSTNYAFQQVVFQEGINFSDGGWFDTLIVQVRQGGVWTDVTGFASTPAYPAANNGLNYETYTLTFDTTVGDGIRIYGAPGGTTDFISVGELRVYGQPFGVATATPTVLATATATATLNPTATPTATATPIAPTPSPTPTETIPGLETPTATATPIPTATATATLDDLTMFGSIVAAVPNPIGGGNKNLEVIRDGDFPPVDSTDSAREFDTWDGVNLAAVDWIGYVYPQSYDFRQVVFQEGINFVDGGWFESLTVQVRQGGVWTNVTGLVSTPTYPGINNGVFFETYTLNFDSIVGDGIRIYGPPGGTDDFISVGELRIYGTDAGPTPTPTATLSATPTESPTPTQTATPDATATVAPTTTPTATGAAQPTATLTPVPTVTATPAADELTELGAIVAAVPNPSGGGNKNVEVIRDGDFPPLGSTDSGREFDTWDGVNTASEDWIGYVYSTSYVFQRVVFQEGIDFDDGGWFDTLTVQVRQAGVWRSVTGFVSTPPYPAANDGTNFATYTLTFDPMIGDGIRIYGAPGGVNDFISVGELQVFGVAAPPTPIATVTPSCVVASGIDYATNDAAQGDYWGVTQTTPTARLTTRQRIKLTAPMSICGLDVKLYRESAAAVAGTAHFELWNDALTARVDGGVDTATVATASLGTAANPPYTSLGWGCGAVAPGDYWLVLMGTGFDSAVPNRLLWTSTNGGYPAGSDASYAAYRGNAQLETDDFVFRLRGLVGGVAPTATAAATTATPTSTATASFAVTTTPTPETTATATPTTSATTTSVSTPTGTVTATPTASATVTATPTASATATSVSTATGTVTPTPSVSATPTATLTATPSATATVTPTTTRTPTPTTTATVTPTTTATVTATVVVATTSPTPTAIVGVPTVTPTGTATPAATTTPGCVVASGIDYATNDAAQGDYWGVTQTTPTARLTTRQRIKLTAPMSICGLDVKLYRESAAAVAGTAHFELWNDALTARVDGGVDTATVATASLGTAANPPYTSLGWGCGAVAPGDYWLVLMGTGFDSAVPNRLLWTSTNGGYPAGSDASYAAYRGNAQLETDDFVFRLRGSAGGSAPTATPTGTATAPGMTATPTRTATPTPASTATLTTAATTTPIATGTVVVIATLTATPIATATSIGTPTVSATPTATSTPACAVASGIDFATNDAAQGDYWGVNETTPTVRNALRQRVKLATATSICGLDVKLYRESTGSVAGTAHFELWNDALTARVDGGVDTQGVAVASLGTATNPPYTSLGWGCGPVAAGDYWLVLMGSGFNRVSPNRLLWSATNGGYPAGSDASYAAYRSNAQLETDDFVFRLRGSAGAP